MNDDAPEPAHDAAPPALPPAPPPALSSAPPPAPPDQHAPWPQRLAFYVDTAREMSLQTEPQAMVQAYGRRMRALAASDASVSLSRRGYQRPVVRVTRATLWGQEVNPWTSERVVVHHGGFFSELIWKDEVTMLDDFTVPEDDPAAPFCQGMRSFIAIPLFDAGVAMNMVVVMRREAAGFPRELVPERVMMSNLFGRATHNLVLREQVREAYEQLDRELQVVADIQRSLLPAALPRIPGVELAAHYRTSTRAGGDYYDFFPLPDGRVGILIADVSGHGTPAAVLMAVTHSIAHTHHGPPAPPSLLMNFVNRHLAARYTAGTGTFVTAFYGIYHPATRELTYACAGHCPPRLRRSAAPARDASGAAGAGVASGVGVVDAGAAGAGVAGAGVAGAGVAGAGVAGAGVAGAGATSVSSPFDHAGLPLGIDPDECYTDGRVTFAPGDLCVFYTDGVTEARRPDNELFGVERLDAVLAAPPLRSAGDTLADCLKALETFTGGRPPTDDQTLLVASFH